jgi:hypothetical protein
LSLDLGPAHRHRRGEGPAPPLDGSRVPQAIITTWGPPLILPSPCLRNRCSYRCHALGTAALVVAAPWGRRPTPSPCREEAVTVSDGGHRRRCPPARCGGTVAMPEVVEEAALKSHAASGVEEGGGRTLKRKEEVVPSRGRRKPRPHMVTWHRHRQPALINQVVSSLV